MNKTFPRILDSEIKESLNKFPIILLEGFSGSGKSFLGGKYSKSSISFSASNNQDYLYTADTKPLNLLIGDYPRLIDGVEIKEKMVDAAKLFMSTKKDGKLILTSLISLSSSKNPISLPTFFVYPFSLFESKESNGNVSLKSLFDKKKIELFKLSSSLTLEQLIFATCRGGFPKALLAIDKDEKLKIAKNLLQDSLRRNLNFASDNERDFQKASSLVKSFSKNLLADEKNKFLLSQVNKSAELSRTSYFSYKKSLESIFLTLDIKPWNTNLRSKGVVITSPRKIFIDPSLAIASLNLKPKDFQTGLLKFSYFFKNLVMRDLLIYSQSLGGRLYYYSDRYGLNVDSILELNDGRYALINIELGSFNVDESSSRLNKLEKLILSYNSKNKKLPLMEPTLKLIITGSQRGLVRDDDVTVVPIGCLRD